MSQIAIKGTDAVTFRKTAMAVAQSLLKDWVGEERAAEATGRISAALSASAASARDPSDFYACTPQSIAVCVATAALTGIMPGTGSCALAYVQPQRARKSEPPMLQYSLSHRGLNALARRSGQTMIAIPIGFGDKISVTESGDIRIIERDIDNPPMKFEELRGVVVIVRELETSVVTCTQWVPIKLIEPRRAMSRSWSGNGRQYSPWENWPVEMSMKTAMHYAISRGWCVIDDADSTKAISADNSNDVIEAEFSPAKKSAAAALSERLSDVHSRELSEGLSKAIDTVSEPTNATRDWKADIAKADPPELDEIAKELVTAVESGIIGAEEANELTDAMNARYTTLEG